MKSHISAAYVNWRITQLGTVVQTAPDLTRWCTAADSVLWRLRRLLQQTTRVADACFMEETRHKRC
jgi:hypothetical protein